VLRTADHTAIYCKFYIRCFGELTSTRIDWPRVGLLANCPVRPNSTRRTSWKL